MGLHRIRLAAPWELSYQKSDSAETAPASSNRKLPLALSELDLQESASDAQTILLSRKFHCPTGLDASTRVYIEIALEDFAAAATLVAVMLNKESMSITNRSDEEQCLLQIDVSGRLMAFNVIQLQFPFAASHTSGRLLSVTLMIEEQAGD